MRRRGCGWSESALGDQNRPATWRRWGGAGRPHWGVQAALARRGAHFDPQVQAAAAPAAARPPSAASLLRRPRRGRPKAAASWTTAAGRPPPPPPCAAPAAGEVSRIRTAHAAPAAAARRPPIWSAEIQSPHRRRIDWAPARGARDPTRKQEVANRSGNNVATSDGGAPGTRRPQGHTGTAVRPPWSPRRALLAAPHGRRSGATAHQLGSLIEGKLPDRDLQSTVAQARSGRARGKERRQWQGGRPADRGAVRGGGGLRGGWLAEHCAARSRCRRAPGRQGVVCTVSLGWRWAGGCGIRRGALGQVLPLDSGGSGGNGAARRPRERRGGHGGAARVAAMERGRRPRAGGGGAAPGGRARRQRLWRAGNRGGVRRAARGAAQRGPRGAGRAARPRGAAWAGRQKRPLGRDDRGGGGDRGEAGCRGRRPQRAHLEREKKRQAGTSPFARRDRARARARARAHTAPCSCRSFFSSLTTCR
jgi:hypothetical protein